MAREAMESISSLRHFVARHAALIVLVMPIYYYTTQKHTLQRANPGWRYRFEVKTVKTV